MHRAAVVVENGNGGVDAEVAIECGEDVARCIRPDVGPAAVGIGLAALLFGMFDALSVIMPGLFNWIPAELIRMIPFVVTVVALILFSYRAMLARRTVAAVDK